MTQFNYARKVPGGYSIIGMETSEYFTEDLPKMCQRNPQFQVLVDPEKNLSLKRIKDLANQYSRVLVARIAKVLWVYNYAASSIPLKTEADYEDFIARGMALGLVENDLADWFESNEDAVTAALTAAGIAYQKLLSGDVNTEADKEVAATFPF